jgi:hypothetical protein
MVVLDFKLENLWLCDDYSFHPTQLFQFGFYVAETPCH